MPRDARGCEAKKPPVMLSVNLRIPVLTGGDVADSQKMALEVTHPHNDLDNIFLHTRYRAWGHPKHLLKPTLRLPHRTNARQLYAHVCGTHGGTFVWWRIRVTAVGEEWRVFEARERGTVVVKLGCTKSTSCIPAAAPRATTQSPATARSLLVSAFYSRESAKLVRVPSSHLKSHTPTMYG